MIGAGGAGRPGRCRQFAEARSGPRRTAHRRRHHLVRIQKVFRKGSRSRPPLPTGESRRARRRRSARSCCAAWFRALEKHHNVRILDEGLSAAVKLSHRYLPDRQLPDKAVSVLDTTCARLALGQNTIPPPIEDATRTLDDIAVQTRVLERRSRPWRRSQRAPATNSASRKPLRKRAWPACRAATIRNLRWSTRFARSAANWKRRMPPV